MIMFYAYLKMFYEYNCSFKNFYVQNCILKCFMDKTVSLKMFNDQKYILIFYEKKRDVLSLHIIMWYIKESIYLFYFIYTNYTLLLYTLSYKCATFLFVDFTLGLYAVNVSSITLCSVKVSAITTYQN